MLELDPAKRPLDAGEACLALLAVQRSLEPRRLARTAWAVAAVALVVALAAALWPRPPRLPPGRLLVALADTANATGERDLDDLSALLHTALEQSQRLSLLARSRLLNLLHPAGGGAPARLDEAAAREAARKVEAHALLVPAVRRLGDVYEVEVRGLEPGRNEALLTVREQVSGKGAIRDALDRLSDEVRARLGEDASRAREPRLRLAQVIPADPEVWRLHGEATRLASEAAWETAAAAWKRALEADPEFPLAHVGLARASMFEDDDAVRHHLEAASRHLDRVPPKERMLVDATRARLEWRLADAVAQYDRVIAGWPQAPEAYAEAGTLVFHMWNDLRMARPYLEQALALGALPRMTAIEFAVWLGRLDEGLERARRWAEDEPGITSLVALSFVHRARGEVPEALDAARRAVALGTHPGRPKLFWAFVEADALEELEDGYRRRGERSDALLALRGRRRGALAVLDARAPPPGAPAAARGMYHNLRADFLAWDGDPDAVWKEIEEQLRLGFVGAECGASVLAWLGDLERADRLMGLWPAQDPRLYCTRLYRLLRDSKRGEREKALQGLSDISGAPAAAFFRGELLAEMGRDREAVEAFRRFRRLPEYNFDASFPYPRSLYLEAASLERLGDREEALRTVDRLLRMWRHADPDIPTLRNAKALRKRLAADTGRR